MNHINKTVFAIGCAFITGLDANNVVNATENPFALSVLPFGCFNMAEPGTDNPTIRIKDSACGEGKCGSAD
jgi:hypothetical protein